MIWAQRPSDLRELGYTRDARHLFGRIQRTNTWDDAGPVLSRAGQALIAPLDQSLPTVSDVVPSQDGSQRIVLSLPDSTQIEAVHMPRGDRTTICLSSQVGCAMGCTFCATATMGLKRHLTANEIVGQLLAILHRFGPRSSSFVNIVFMGMGEPLHNVDALIRVLDVICDPAGLGISPSRITVSTAGHVAGLDRLIASGHRPELAVSVNAMKPDVRRHLMPIDRKWSLTDLRAALDRWNDVKRPHSKITIEYVLLRDVNDDLESASLLARWLRPRREGQEQLRHVVNVIPFNAWSGAPFTSSTTEAIDTFVTRLREEGCLVKVRLSRGQDSRAACGQLLRPQKRISEIFTPQELRTV
jgi:23S rRNA (adenine2503-C2)-methyltransferase